MSDSFAVTDHIAERWNWWGGPGGPFGQPVAAQETVAGRNGVRQRFERGEIAWSPDQDMITSVYLLRNEACLEWSRPSSDFDSFRYNVACDGVPQGQDDTAISFNDVDPEGELFTWTRLQGFGEFSFVVQSCNGDDRGAFTIPVRVTFASLGDSPFPDDPPVVGLIADRWHELGAWNGLLGRPVEAMVFDTEGEGLRQQFERGAIQTVPAEGAHMVIGGYQRLLPPDDNIELASPSLELNWGGADNPYNYFRVDVLFAGELTQGVPAETQFGDWARLGAGSGQYQLRAPANDGAYVFEVYAAVAPPFAPLSGVVVTFPDEPTVRLLVNLHSPVTPWRIPIELPSLDGTPAAAFASHRDRALSVARAYATTRPLRPTLRQPVTADAPAAGETDGVRLMAHFAAAAEEPDFSAPGELPSLVLAHIELRRMRLGPMGTNTAGTPVPGVSYHRAGDYDTALRGLLVIAYRYGYLLTDAEIGFMLHRLVPPGLSDGHPLSIETVDIEVDLSLAADLGLDTLVSLVSPTGLVTILGAVLAPITVGEIANYYTHGVPESENHILMIESARYLVNQLFLDRTHDQRYNNTTNGQTGWLLGWLQTITQHDFLEFNARVYTRYSIHALLNLHEFARDAEVRTMAHNILDYTTVRFALSSNRFRRVNPYRRLVDNRDRIPYTVVDDMGVSQLHKEFDDLYSQKMDPMMGFFFTWIGDRTFRGEPLPTFPEWWDFLAILAGQAAYRPPPQAYSLAMTSYPPVQHTYFHGTRPKVTGSSDVADSGVEIYYRSPSFMLSAGGMGLNSGYGHDAFHTQDVAIAQSTTLIPTLADPVFSECIRFDPFPNMYAGINTGVHMGFACGANLQIPPIWYNLTHSSAEGPWTFLNLNDDIDRLHPENPFEEKPGHMGFYLAAYRTPPASTDALSDFDTSPESLGMLYAMEAGDWQNPVMSFDDFKNITKNANQLPAELEYGQTFDFHTADGHTFTCRLSTTGGKYAPRVLRMDGVDLPGDFTGPLVRGTFMNADSTHSGLVTVTSPDCGVPLLLDSRDKDHPARTDTETMCAQQYLDRAQALMAVARQNNSESQTASGLVASQGWQRTLRAARAAAGVLEGFDPPPAVRSEYLLLLGQMLRALALALLHAGRADEAAAAAQEAVLVDLEAARAAESNPMTVSAEMTLLDGVLAALHLTAKAVDFQQAIVDLLQGFTPARADQVDYLIDLAEARHNLLVRLTGDHRPDEAATWAAPAIAAYRQYTAAGGVDVSRLNRDLIDLDKQLLALGLTAAAVDSQQVLVDALQGFTPAAADRLNYQITFAEARHNLIIRLFDDHRPAEAAPLIPPVIAAYRDYAATAGADLSRVATDLHDLTGQLLGAGLTAESAAAQQVLDSVPAG
jgi:hypothetical protein